MEEMPSGMETDAKFVQPEYLQRTDSQVDANKTVEKRIIQ